MDDEEQGALGIVPLEGRGSLPYALVHGESLVAAASWALTTAGAELFDYDLPHESVRESGRMLVVHDPLCPLTPVSFIEQAILESTRTGSVVVGVRPVTDTIREYDGRVLGAACDRDDLICVTSPVVLPAGVVAALDRIEVGDLARFVAELARTFPVRYVEAPTLGRRIGEQNELELLEALSEATG